MTNNVFEDSFPEKPFKPNKAYFKDLASTVYKDLTSTPESENTNVSWKRNVFDGNDANLAVTYVREASLEELSKVSVMTPEDFQEKFLDAFEKLVNDHRFELVKDIRFCRFKRFFFAILINNRKVNFCIISNIF